MPTPTTPLIIIGKNIGFSLASATVDGTTGVVTVGTGVALTGKAKRGAKRHRRRTFESMPLDAVIVNNVPFVDDWVIELSTIRRIVAPNPIDDKFAVGAFGSIAFSSPTTNDAYIGVFTNYDWEAVQEENLESLTMIPIDTGTSNPTRT